MNRTLFPALFDKLVYNKIQCCAECYSSSLINHYEHLVKVKVIFVGTVYLNVSFSIFFIILINSIFVGELDKTN